jgi:gamma-glutamyl:cysteine ligase YbdK (ATP-grasp superfamily)
MEDDDFGWLDAVGVTVAVLLALAISSPWWQRWDIYIP